LKMFVGDMYIDDAVNVNIDRFTLKEFGKTRDIYRED
jgi:hypothetical protein